VPLETYLHPFPSSLTLFIGVVTTPVNPFPNSKTKPLLPWYIPL